MAFAPINFSNVVIAQKRYSLDSPTAFPNNMSKPFAGHVRVVCGHPLLCTYFRKVRMVKVFVSCAVMRPFGCGHVL